MPKDGGCIKAILVHEAHTEFLDTTKQLMNARNILKAEEWKIVNKSKST